MCHWHKWGRWSNRERSFITNSNLYQYRTCETCGKIKKRKV
jgi:hypothetical protein